MSRDNIFQNDGRFDPNSFFEDYLNITENKKSSRDSDSTRLQGEMDAAEISVFLQGLYFKLMLCFV